MRRLLTHVRALPVDSAFIRTRRGVTANWTQEAELLATVLDAVRENTHFLLMVNGNTPQPPAPFPRPGTPVEVPVQASLADLASFLRED